HLPILLHDHEPNLALLRLASAYLLDQLAAAHNQVVRVKHEQYGGRLVGYLEPRASLWLRLFLSSCRSWQMPCSDIANGTGIAKSGYSPSLRLGAVTRAAETEWNGSVARLARNTQVSTDGRRRTADVFFFFFFKSINVRLGPITLCSTSL
ncbi:hypothetical protein EDB85DRAFT_2035886, partial [Lactarius pseudohatsudake]